MVRKLHIFLLFSLYFAEEICSSDSLSIPTLFAFVDLNLTTRSAELVSSSTFSNFSSVTYIMTTVAPKPNITSIFSPKPNITSTVSPKPNITSTVSPTQSSTTINVSPTNYANNFSTTYSTTYSTTVTATATATATLKPTTVGNALSTTSIPTSTITHPYYSPDNLTTLDLILIISIPCAALVLIVCICAICCVKCANVKRAMMSLGGPFNNKNHNENITNTSFHSPAATEPIKTFAETNHYMDISLLASKTDCWELKPENLIINENEILGNGAFAYVYKGNIIGEIPLLKAERGITLSIEHRLQGQHEAAVKRLPAHADHQNRLDFFHEIEFMKKLGYHVHVVAMLGCVSDLNDPLILVEYCQRGDLLRFLRDNRMNAFMETGISSSSEICLKLKDLISFAWQISDGMNYLSSRGFIHRDVAARNILVTHNMIAKVSDFGLCRYVDSSLYVAKGGKLPIKWMAIESLKFYEYSSKSDVWAFGVTLFEIFSLGDGPYPGIQPLDMMKYLEDGNRLLQPERCPNEIYEIMSQCWLADKDKRPTFSELKAKIAILLNLDDEHYGYLTVTLLNEEVENSSKTKLSLNFKDVKKSPQISREECLISDDELIEAIHIESQKMDESENKSTSELKL